MKLFRLFISPSYLQSRPMQMLNNIDQSTQTMESLDNSSQ